MMTNTMKWWNQPAADGIRRLCKESEQMIQPVQECSQSHGDSYARTTVHIDGIEFQ